MIFEILRVVLKLIFIGTGISLLFLHYLYQERVLTKTDRTLSVIFLICGILLILFGSIL